MDMIIRLFKECGKSVARHSSEDGEINIIGLKDYTVRDSEDEATDDYSHILWSIQSLFS